MNFYEDEYKETIDGYGFYMFHAHAKRVALPYDVMIFYGLFVRASVARVMGFMMYIDFSPE
jgi:hypothetical protein